jgi:thiol:disulfide interchange protein DsbG
MTLRLPPLPCLAASALLAFASVHVPAAQWAPPAESRGAPVTWGDLERAKWIADGRDDAPRKVYVFMDANCKYCTNFWSNARPWVDSGKVQLRHIMVAVIAPTSAGKAATLLADPDPAQRLAGYERAHAFGVARMMAGGPHHGFDDPKLPPMQDIPPAIASTLAHDEELMGALGLRGTPGIVYRGLDGGIAVRPGVTPDKLPLVFGSL